MIANRLLLVESWTVHGNKDIKFVMVNPHHVYKGKELDDNSPSKNDRKDSCIIV